MGQDCRTPGAVTEDGRDPDLPLSCPWLGPEQSAQGGRKAGAPLQRGRRPQSEA